MPYLIDGHNLIPKVGLRLDSPDDEPALISILQQFVRLARRGVEVFFDGAPPGSAGTRRFGQITAHFVRLGSSADAAITARLRTLGRAARNWVVVTSDNEVQGEARAVGASVESAERFASRLRAVNGKTARRAPPDEHELSDQELQDWLDAFRNRRPG